ncbi:hypothetical protein ADEAN_000362000 [Angomonas deanei]|uniref:Uncharacterized protein n=1 Tax=Angomonas deanei TaxID=59799 RepID=A0A7G2C9D0_9TRYP|nr:hypothetical protein ADEAN_000362000 [Angomonas deanei]
MPPKKGKTRVKENSAPTTKKKNPPIASKKNKKVVVTRKKTQPKGKTSSRVRPAATKKKTTTTRSTARRPAVKKKDTSSRRQTKGGVTGKRKRPTAVDDNPRQTKKKKREDNAVPPVEKEEVSLNAQINQFLPPKTIFSKKLFLLGEKKDDSGVVRGEEETQLTGETAKKAFIDVTVREVSRLITRMVPHLFIEYQKLNLCAPDQRTPAPNPSFLEVSSLLRDPSVESTDDVHGSIFQSLRGSIRAAMILSHRLCVTLWGPRGSGKHRLIKLLLSTFSYRTTTTGGDGNPNANSNPHNCIIELDGSLIENDAVALSVIAQQLYYFLCFHLFEVEVSNNNHNNSVSSQLRADESIASGYFEFGSLFGFPKKFASVRERMAAAKQERHHSPYATTTAKNGKKNDSRDAFTNHNDEDEEEEGAEQYFSTDTNTSGALAPLQRILLQLKNNFKINIIIFIRDVEKFGIQCDQLFYVLSGLLHDNNNTNHNQSNHNPNHPPPNTGSAGSLCLLLSSGSADLHALEKRLSSRLTTEVRYVPMLSYYHSDIPKEAPHRPVGPTQKILSAVCTALKEIVIYYYKVNLLLEKYHPLPGREDEDDPQDREEELEEVKRLLLEKYQTIHALIPLHLFSSLFDQCSAVLLHNPSLNPTELPSSEGRLPKETVTVVSSSSSCVSSFSDETERESRLLSPSDSEDEEETVDLEYEHSYNEFYKRNFAAEKGTPNSPHDANRNAPSLLFHPTILWESMIFILDLLLEEFHNDGEGDAAGDDDSHRKKEQNSFVSVVKETDRLLSSTGAVGNSVWVVIARLLSTLHPNTSTTVSLLGEEDASLLERWLENRISLEIKILKRNNQNKLVFPWREEAVCDELALLTGEENSKPKPSDKKSLLWHRLAARPHTLTAPTAVYSALLHREKDRRPTGRGKKTPLLTNPILSPLNEPIVRLVPPYYPILLYEKMRKEERERQPAAHRTKAPPVDLRLLPPNVYDLLEENKILELSYLSREGVLLLFYLLLYTEQHQSPTTLHRPAAATSHGDNVYRSLQDLIEDVSSSLGTAATKSLDKRLFYLAAHVLARWRLVEIVKHVRQTAQHAGPQRQTNWSHQNVHLSLCGSVQRVRNFLVTLFLHKKNVCQMQLGIDAREVLRMSSML